MTASDKPNVPDAEFEEEKKSAPEPKAEPVKVIYPKDPAPEENPVKIRVETQSRHRLGIRIFEVDEDGVIDIIISDADVN